MPLDWDAALKAAWQNNYDSFDVNNASQKIATFASRSGLSEDAIKQKIKEDDIFRWVFVYDPKKQNIYEKIAAEYISKMDGIANFKKLPNNAKIMSSGMVLSRKDLKNQGGVVQIKTIDFEWTYKDWKVFAYHKYTRESGGAQDKQYDDLYNFIHAANETHLPKTAFIAIADGPYYDTGDALRGDTKIENLVRDANESKHAYAGTIEDIPNIMQDLLNASCSSCKTSVSNPESSAQQS